MSKSKVNKFLLFSVNWCIKLDEIIIEVEKVEYSINNLYIKYPYLTFRFKQ